MKINTKSHMAGSPLSYGSIYLVFRAKSYRVIPVGRQVGHCPTLLHTCQPLLVNFAHVYFNICLPVCQYVLEYRKNTLRFRLQNDEAAIAPSSLPHRGNVSSLLWQTYRQKLCVARIVILRLVEESF